MGALDTLLTVVNIGATAANYGRLQELQQQQGQTQAIAMLVQLARDMLFNFKQAADDALANESVNPKLSAAKLQMLVLGLSEMGITPQMFPDLADKEYAATTQKYITANYERIMDQLPAEDQKEVEEAVQAVQQHADAEYYLEHWDSVEDYRQAKPLYDELSGRHGCLKTIGIGMLFYLGLGLVALAGAGSGSEAIVILAFIVWVVGLIFVIRWRRGKEYKEAKKTIDTFESGGVDLEKYVAAETRLGVEQKEQAGKLLAATETKIKRFFGTKTARLLPE